ncbi:RagB/SusD family nutrient uptake outer membrane protein [Flavitalea flava]
MRKIISLLLISALGLCSCQKFLAEKSQSEFTPVTTEDYSELLYGSGYPNAGIALAPQLYFMDDDNQSYFGIVSDNLLCMKALPVYSWQPDWYTQIAANALPTAGTNSYKTIYGLIVGANVAIQDAQGTVGTKGDKDYLQGQGYGLRAFYYWLLVNLYGRPYNDSTTTPDKSPGIPLILTPNLSQVMPVRNSVAQVYHQIVADLDSACLLLDPAKKTSDPYRMNYLAAHLLASRVFLYTEQWDSAVYHASYVLKNNPQLLNLGDLAASGYDPLAGTSFVPIIGVGGVETLWTYGSTSDNYNFAQSTVNFSLSQDLFNQYDPNDLRTQYYISVAPPFLLPYVSVPTVEIKRNYTSNTINRETGSAFRTSEAYLNRAEAYAQQALKGQNDNAAQSAINDLNTLRTNRFPQAAFVPLTNVAPDSLLQFCRNERRRELFSETQRWFDLRRYGMPSITHFFNNGNNTVKYVLNRHDPEYVLPLPAEALKLNSSLQDNPAGPVRMPAP